MRSKEKLKVFVQEAVTKMMEVSGHNLTYEDMVKISKKRSDWYDHYTITPEQELEFQQWFIPKAMKELGWSKRKTEEELSWFLLDYGLRVDYENN